MGSFGLPAALGAAVLLSAISFPATAQSPQAPVRLTPPQNLRPDQQAPIPLSPQTDSPQPSSAAPAEQPTAGEGVQVDTLQSINPDTAGAIGEAEGGFAQDMWNGTSRRVLESMLQRLPVDAASTTMRDLMARLLLSMANLPPGMPGDGSHVATRVGLLAEMGELTGVSRLLEATPGRSRIDSLVRHEADVRFLSNDNARACALAAGQIGEHDSPYWLKAFIFCQALAGEHDKAALGVSLLREVSDGDAGFYALVDALAGGKGKLDSLTDPRPIHLAMARVAKVQLPGDIVSTNRPGLLRAIAISPNAPVEIRLEAAERAELAGALAVDTLRQLYTSVSFSNEELANPLSKAEAESGPLSRALLYRTSLIQTVPTAQAEVTARALSLGREGGRYASAVRVFMPILKRIPPAAELVWFAPETIRAFLAEGEHAAARPWFALLRANAAFNEESAEALARLMPLARLAMSPEAADWGPPQLASWWNGIKDSDDGRDKAALLYSLFDALGDPVPEAAWEVLLDGSARTTMAMPNPALWRRLEALRELQGAPEPTTGEPDEPAQAAPADAMPAPVAASGAVQGAPLTEASRDMAPSRGPKRIGEVVLLSMLALGEGGPGQAEPLVMYQVLKSLRAVGLQADARALAMEAVILAGL